MFRIKNVRNSTVAKSHDMSPAILPKNFQQNHQKPPSRKAIANPIRQSANELKRPTILPKKQIIPNPNGVKPKPILNTNHGKISSIKSPIATISKKQHPINSGNTLHIHKRQLKKIQNPHPHIENEEEKIPKTILKTVKDQEIIIEKKQILKQQFLQQTQIKKQDEKFYQWVIENERKNREMEELQKNQDFQKQKQIEERVKIEEAQRRKQQRIQRKKQEQLEQQQREAEMQVQIKKIQERRRKRLQQKQRKQQQARKRQELQNQLEDYMRQNNGPIGEYSLGGMVHLPQQLAHFEMADIIMDAQIKKLIKMNFASFPNQNTLEAQRDELERVNTSYMIVREDPNNRLIQGLKNYRIEIFNRIGQLIMQAQNQGFTHPNFQIIQGDSRLPLSFGNGTKILQGLNQNHIENLTQKFTVAKDQQCNICLNMLEKGSQARKLKCGHFFHLECIDSWLQSRANCPSCRFNVKYANKG